MQIQARREMPTRSRRPYSGRTARRTIAVAATLLCLGSITGNRVDAIADTTTDGAATDQYALSAGAQWHVWSPAPGHVANYPQAFATDHVVNGRTQKKVFAYWQNTLDDGSYATAGGRAVSDDGAETFPTMSTGLGSTTSGARLNDGSLLTIKFLVSDYPQRPHRYHLMMSRSVDLGRTWTDVEAPLDTGRYELAWLRIHRGILQLTDGTLLVPMYGVKVGDGSQNSSFLLASTDRGATWSIRSRISDADRPGTNEAFVTYTSDGRLVAFMRSINEKDLLQAFSNDNGHTWTTPTVIAAPAGAPTGLADPAAVLQPNGMLVLSYGRPDNTILVSRDGTGRTWDDYRNVFSNKPRSTAPGNIHASSGNTALVNTGPNYSVVFGDTCGHQWMCREKGQQYGIWARRIDAVTPGGGKIDLATRVNGGSVTLAGELKPADSRFPEARIEGAVDGSAERYAAARLAPGGKLVVTLDRVYTLNKVGLMLGYGIPQDADVQLSVDGKTWGAPVIKKRQTVDYALRYTDIEPTQARYVKMNAPSGGRLDAVTELELYAADLLSFENDAVGAPPRGFTDTRYAWVNDTIMPGYHSERRLSLVDADADAEATATLRTAARGSQRLSYAYSAMQYAAGMQILIRGKNSAGGDVHPWQFRLSPFGTGFRVSAYDGANWQVVGSTAYRPPNNVWTTIVIDTTSERATLTIGKETLNTTVRAADAVSFTGVTFNTGIPVPPVFSGMQHDFDEIEVTAIP